MHESPARQRSAEVHPHDDSRQVRAVVIRNVQAILRNRAVADVESLAKLRLGAAV